MNNDNNFQPQPQAGPEPQMTPPVVSQSQPFEPAQPSAPFQSAPVAEPVQPQIAPSPLNTFGQPSAPVAEPVAQPVSTPAFDATPVQPQPTQPQPAAQPTARKKGAPLWMWIMLGVAVLLVAGAIAAVLLIK